MTGTETGTGAGIGTGTGTGTRTRTQTGGMRTGTRTGNRTGTQTWTWTGRRTGTWKGLPRFIKALIAENIVQTNTFLQYMVCAEQQRKEILCRSESFQLQYSIRNVHYYLLCRYSV
jgi:hypothetical protein